MFVFCGFGELRYPDPLITYYSMLPWPEFSVVVWTFSSSFCKDASCKVSALDITFSKVYSFQLRFLYWFRDCVHEIEIVIEVRFSNSKIGTSINISDSKL